MVFIPKNGHLRPYCLSFALFRLHFLEAVRLSFYQPYQPNMANQANIINPKKANWHSSPYFLSHLPTFNPTHFVDFLNHSYPFPRILKLRASFIEDFEHKMYRAPSRVGQGRGKNAIRSYYLINNERSVSLLQPLFCAKGSKVLSQGQS